MIHLIVALSLSLFAQAQNYIPDLLIKMKHEKPNTDQLLAKSALGRASLGNTCKRLLSEKAQPDVASKSQPSFFEALANKFSGTQSVSATTYDTPQFKELLAAPVWVGAMLNQAYYSQIPFTASDIHFLNTNTYASPIKLKVNKDALPKGVQNIEAEFSRAQANQNPYESSFARNDLPEVVELQVFNADRNLSQIHLKLVYSETEHYSLGLNVSLSGGFMNSPANISEGVAQAILRLLNYHSIFEEKAFAHEVNELRYNLIKLAALSTSEIDRTDYAQLAQSLQFDERTLLTYSIDKINILDLYLKAKARFLVSVQAHATSSKNFYRTSTPSGYDFYYPHNNEFSTLMRTWIFEPSMMMNHPLFATGRMVLKDAMKSLFSAVTDRTTQDFESLPENVSQDFSIQPLFSADHQVIDSWDTQKHSQQGLLYFDLKDGKFHPAQPNQKD